MNLQLKKFKPESITDDRVCVFIGKRNTGKSTLVKDIMYHKRHLPAGIVLSGTEEVMFGLIFTKTPRLLQLNSTLLQPILFIKINQLLITSYKVGTTTW